MRSSMRERMLCWCYIAVGLKYSSRKLVLFEYNKNQFSQQNIEFNGEYNIIFLAVKHA